MKRTKLLLLTLMTMVLSVTTSCLDNDNDNDRISVQVKYDRVFSSVRNSATGTTFNSPETVYTIEIDYTNRLMRIGVNNIRLNQTDDSHTFVLEGVKLTSATTDGALLAEASSLQPVDGITVTDLKVSLRDRVIDGIYRPVYSISYTVNSDYQVTVVPNTCYYFGTLTSVNDATGATFTKTNLPVEVTFDLATNKAKMRLKGVKFVAAMPRELDMTFPGIDFTTSPTGYSLKASSIIPEIGEDPYPGYPITNLNATATMSSGKMESTFTCTPEKMGAYTVSLSLSPQIFQ